MGVFVRDNVKIIYSWKGFFSLIWPFIKNKNIFLDAGSGKPFYGSMKKYKPFFIDKKYIALDYNIKNKPTIVGNLHQLPIKSNSIEVVLAKAVFEHVANPFIVTKEIYRVLKPKGVAIIWAPFLYVYHADKSYKDYFRFTEDGIKEILKDFKRMTIFPTRGYLETLTNLLPFPFNKIFIIPARIFDMIRPIKNQYSGFGVIAIK